MKVKFWKQDTTLTGVCRNKNEKEQPNIELKQYNAVTVCLCVYVFFVVYFENSLGMCSVKGGFGEKKHCQTFSFGFDLKTENRFWAI